MDSSKRSALQTALTPSPARQYHAVDPKLFDPATRAKLVAEYARVMKLKNTDGLKIFAVTDPLKGETVLFPEFYQLSRNDQEAILVHEAYWIINPNAEYADTISAEMSFEAYLEGKLNQNWEARFAFSKYFQTQTQEIEAARDFDLANGTLIGWLNPDQSVSFEKFFGKDFLACTNTSKDTFDLCPIFLKKNWLDLENQFPSSRLIKIFADTFLNQPFFSGYGLLTLGYNPPNAQAYQETNEQSFSLFDGFYWTFYRPVLDAYWNVYSEPTEPFIGQCILKLDDAHFSSVTNCKNITSIKID